MADIRNLLAASTLAMKGKGRRPDVQAWAMHEEAEVSRLQEELLAGAWQPGGYHLFTIHEPKRRVIAAAPFRDRVVHHALCRVLRPVLERSFIPRSFSCQLDKGTSAARECCRRLVNRHRYVLKCDVSKFFHQIDQRILRDHLAGRVACSGILDVMDGILASYRTTIETSAPLFPGDDLVEAMERPRGLPIGNLTSQLWANSYLDAMDHRITEVERHGAYIRYTDDFLLFGDDKQRLWDLREVIVSELMAVRLKLAIPKSRMLACREGVPFCGFRFLPGVRPRILGATKRRFEERRHRMFETGAEPSAISLSIYAWYQFSREGATEGLRRAYSKWPLDPGMRRRRGRKPCVARRFVEQQ